MMKTDTLLSKAMLPALCVYQYSTLATAQEQPEPKPREIATTDGEVDDRSSMIRLLLYACDL